MKKDAISGAMSYIGEDLLEEAESYKSGDISTAEQTAESTGKTKRIRFETFAGIAAALVIIIELGIGIKLLSDNITPAETSSVSVTTPVTEETSESLEATEETALADSIRADFGLHFAENESTFDMALAKEFFYANWHSENGNTPYEDIVFAPRGNVTFNSSYTDIHSVFGTEDFVYIYGSKADSNLMFAIDRNDPETMYYMQLFFIDENGNIHSTNSENPIPLYKYNKSGNAQYDENDELSLYGFLEITEESGIPLKTLTDISYTDENTVLWTRFGGGAVCPDYPVYLTAESEGSYSFSTKAALYSDTYQYESNVQVRDIDYTILIENGEWWISFSAASQPYIDSNTIDDTESLRDVLTNYVECIYSGDTGDNMYVLRSYFYSVWQSIDEKNTVTLAPYGYSFGGPTSMPQRVLKHNDYVFVEGVNGGISYIFAIHTANPDIMYYIENVGFSENFDASNYTTPYYIKYSRYGSVDYSTNTEISYFGIIEMCSETGIDVGLIYNVRFTDENGEVWLRETGYGGAPSYPIFLKEQAENSYTFTTIMEGNTSNADNMSNLCTVRYTISKANSDWVQEINEVGEPYTAPDVYFEENNIRNMLTSFNDCVSNDSVEEDIAVAEDYFYGYWLTNESDIPINFSPYGYSFGGSTGSLKRVFLYNGYAYIERNTDGIKQLFVVDTRTPEIMYRFDDLPIDENDEIANASGYSTEKAEKYTRNSFGFYNYEEGALTDFGMKEIHLKSGMDISLIHNVSYTDENGELWTRGDYGNAVLSYPINFKPQTDSSYTFQTHVCSKSEADKYFSGETDEIKTLRNVTYTVSKIDDVWVQTIDSISEPSERENDL